MTRQLLVISESPFAMRIKGRAVERLGALVDELPAMKGGDGLPKAGRPSLGDTPRQEAARTAGLSKDQVKQAVNVHRFAKQEPERFEKMVEGGRA